MNIWKLRPEQEHAFSAACGRPMIIINMPTGSGKTFILTVLSSHDLRNTSRKVVICVPQRIIAKGFAKAKRIELPDGEVVKWSVPRNLCGDSTAKVCALKRFLLDRPGESMASRVVLTTHMTLSYALRQIGDEELVGIADETTVVIDEAHHIMGAELSRNALGDQMARLLDLGAPGLKMWLATAYFFRGDHFPILSDAHLSEFERVHVPFDEYWGTLRHIQSYSYDFVAYKGTIFRELEHVLRSSPKVPTIIYCPPEGHRMLLGKDKSKFVNRIEQITRRSLNAKRWTTYEEALRQHAVVVDLVDTNGRDDKIRFIAEHGDRVAAILTVGMFKEGADWVQAARIVDLVPTNSDQDRLQRFGRLVRDWPGKAHVTYLSFFPLVVEQREEERRHQLTKLYAHFHASLVLENAIHPIRVPVHPGPKKERPEDDKTSQRHFDLLGEYSQPKQEAIIRDSYEALLRLQVQSEEAGISAKPNEVKNAVVSILRENGVRENLEPLARQVLLVMRRCANVSVRTDDLVDAGFDKVWSSDIFKPFIAYSGGLGGPKTLAEIRDTVEGLFERQWHDNYQRVRNLPTRPSTESSAYWWCTHNRTLKARGALPQAKIDLLEQISWWSWTISVSSRWQTSFDAMKSRENCPKAGTSEYGWVRQQRRLQQQGKLAPERACLLESIPWWQWSSAEGLWEAKFSEISALSARPAHGTELYEWLRTQRKAFKAGRLESTRAKKLASLTWWTWEERRPNREFGLERLRACIEEGLRCGDAKSHVAQRWAELVGIGSDQIHKYLREAPPEIREQWARLLDQRSRRN